jgi:hypothetical protein
MGHIRWLSMILCALSVMFFAGSLSQPAFCLRFIPCEGWPGYGVLLLGWIESFDVLEVGPFVAFAWFANPLYLVAVVLTVMGRYLYAVRSAVLAACFSASFLLGSKVVVAEAGGANELVSYALGYWLWLGSILTICVSAWAGLIEKRDEPRSKGYAV